MKKKDTDEFKPNDQKRYVGPKTKNWLLPERWPLIVALLLAVGWARQAFAGGRRENNPSPSVPSAEIVVKLYNQAQVPAEILGSAQGAVMQLLRPADVNIRFVDCPVTREQGRTYLACHQAPDSGFVLKIITLGSAKQLPASSHAFGLAGDCGPRDAACTAYVIYDKTRQFAPNARVSPSMVLGRVLCHELGHLLGLVHSEGSLMRPEWNPNDFDPDNLSHLAFSPRECKQIRARAAARFAKGNE